MRPVCHLNPQDRHLMVYVFKTGSILAKHITYTVLFVHKCYHVILIKKLHLSVFISSKLELIEF